MSFDNIKIEKGMYAVPGKSFTEVLEEIDPSANYAGTELEGLDAFQRQLKRFDIKVAGRNSDMLQKFYSTSDSAALFPEYVSRAVATGIEANDLLSQIVATTTKIEGRDYRSIVSNPSNSNKSLTVVQEGAQIPETSISASEKLVSLNKRGRMLVASYEAIKYQRLDLFTVMLRQIGSYIATQQFEDALMLLIEGDDSNSPVSGITTEQTNGVITYNDFVALWISMGNYEMNTLVANPAMLSKIMKIEEFKNPQTGINFVGTGKFSNILGANLLRCNELPGNAVLALDKNFALEKVVSEDVNVEYDKLIDRQLERAVITSTYGFSRIIDNAAKKITFRTA